MSQDDPADAATDAGNSDSTGADRKSNAYELFLKGMESLGDNNVPDQRRAGVLLLCVRQPS
ncbi:MAG: hypothetical protein ACLR8L_00095 [Oscillospiraceae bacterium]